MAHEVAAASLTLFFEQVAPQFRRSTLAAQ